MKNTFKRNWPIILFFTIVFVVGVLTFRDYGSVNDEIVQREHSFVSYHEYMKILDQIPFFDITTAQDKLLIVNTPEGLPITNINDYDHKYYGTAIQMPLVFIEHVFSFELDIFAILYVRHFYTFCIFFISLIYFFALLNKFILKNKWYSLLGTAFLVLSPRMYGDAFYNIKDSVFTSLCIINMYYSLAYINGNRKRDVVALAFISALATNSRVIGGMIVFLAIVFLLIKERSRMKPALIKTAALIALTWVLYTILTPASWSAPFLFVFQSIDYFFFYAGPTLEDTYTTGYWGATYEANALPWHYLFVWIFITTPLAYVLLFIASTVDKIRRIKNKVVNPNIAFIDMVLFIPLLIFVLFKPTTYCGWRHFYFIYPCIIANVIVAFRHMAKYRSKYQQFLITMVCISLLVNLSWMVKNHPNQREYFNLILEDKCVALFERYWEINRSNALKFILDSDQDSSTICLVADSTPLFLLPDWLPQNDKDRISITTHTNETFKQEVKDINAFKYIIDESSTATADKYGENYEEVFLESVKNFRLCTVYRQKQQ